MSTSQSKLRAHRKILKTNPNRYNHEIKPENISRLVGTLVLHLKRAGYAVTPKKHHDVLSEIITLLFATQHEAPMFHRERDLPVCWNIPKFFNLDYVKYEWGHLTSTDEAGEDSHDIENIGLYSAYCNQFVQASLNMDEVKELFAGDLADRIEEVEAARAEMFASDTWKDLVASLPRKPA